jgi:hypothetical protein
MPRARKYPDSGRARRVPASRNNRLRTAGFVAKRSSLPIGPAGRVPKLL